MVPNFDIVAEFLLKNEGGYSNHVQDKGGATNYGISLPYLRTLGALGDLNHDGLINEIDIRLIDKTKAKSFYKKGFWDKYGYERILNPSIAEKVFDFAVNMGPKNAHRLLQKALNLSRFSNTLEEDGFLGPQTIEAVNRSNAKTLLLRLSGVAACYYIQIVEEQPSQKVFINGWLKRAFEGGCKG